MSGKKLLIISIIVALLVAIPAGLYFYSNQLPKKSQSVASATLAFSPATGIKKVDDTTEFAIKIDPGSNAVSFVSLDITYDASKFSAATNALTIDKTVMPLVMQGPVYTSGRIRVNLSTGNDPQSALTKPAILGKLDLKAIGSTNGSTTSIAFGSGTQILSLSTSTDTTDQSGQNILASTTPAEIMIADSQPHQLVAAASPLPVEAPATQGTATEITPTPTPKLLAEVISPTSTITPTTTVATPTPTKVATPTPTTVKAVAGISDAPTPTTIDTPTSIPTTSQVETTTLTTGTPTPTLEATGPGLTYIGIGAFSLIIFIAGSLILIAL